MNISSEILAIAVDADLSSAAPRENCMLSFPQDPLKGPRMELNMKVAEQQPPC